MTNEELRRLAEAATPGPWYPGSTSSAITADVPQDVNHGIYRGFNDAEYDGRYLLAESVVHQPTAAYIAAANPATVLALLDEIKELRSSVVTFLAPWAMESAQFYGLPERHIHPQHYDLLARCGARMDDFVRHENG